MSQEVNIVAGSQPWIRTVFSQELADLPGDWRFVSSDPELRAEIEKGPPPRRIFFLHWSEIVSRELVETYECVNFHMTDLPRGRGGSPLQHLVLSGADETVLTAHQMTAEIDAGPVYLKRPLSLHGSAEAVYLRAAELASSMIKEILGNEVDPKPQVGIPTFVRRRKPEESRITNLRGLEEAYDFIRMLDAEGYPHAFLEVAGLRLEFTRAVLYSDHVIADVRITCEKLQP